MSPGLKRKAQVTSFNSGVGILGRALGVWRGGQAWREGLKGIEEAQSLVLVGDLGPWYLKPLCQSLPSLSRALKRLERCASPSSPQGGMPKPPVPVLPQGTLPTKLWCQQR